MMIPKNRESAGTCVIYIVVGDVSLDDPHEGGNAAIRGRIEQACRAAGMQAPIICTPEELTEG